VSFFGTLPVVEVHFEAARYRTLLSVHLILEVDEEFFERVDRVTSSHVRDKYGSLKDGGHVAFSLDLFDTLVDHLGNLRAHDFGNLAAVFPENIGDALLSKLSVNTHVESEMLMH